MTLQKSRSLQVVFASRQSILQASPHLFRRTGVYQPGGRRHFAHARFAEVSSSGQNSVRIDHLPFKKLHSIQYCSISSYCFHNKPRSCYFCLQIWQKASRSIGKPFNYLFHINDFLHIIGPACLIRVRGIVSYPHLPHFTRFQEHKVAACTTQSLQTFGVYVLDEMDIITPP